MFEYEYERIACNGFGVVGVKYEEHREIIDKYSKRGYRYVGFVPVEVVNHGFPIKLDLIFEKEVSK